MNANRKNRDKVICEAITQLFAMQLRFGASIEELSNAARTAIRAANRTNLAETLAHSDPDVQGFGSLLRCWHRETRFLSLEGFPRHLSREGRNGLRSLVNMHYPRQHFDSVFNALRRSGLIKQDEKLKWFPTMKHAVFPTLSSELLAHFSEGVARFVETMTRNVGARSKEEVLFERSCKVTSLPPSAAPEFRRFVNGQALAFLEAVDDWLENHSKPTKSSTRKCAAGVFTFAFIDDPTIDRSFRSKRSSR